MKLSRRNLLGLAAAGAVIPGMGLLPRVLHAATPTATSGGRAIETVVMPARAWPPARARAMGPISALWG